MDNSDNKRVEGRANNAAGGQGDSNRIVMNDTDSMAGSSAVSHRESHRGLMDQNNYQNYY